MQKQDPIVFRSVEIIYKDRVLSEVPVDDRTTELKQLIEDGRIDKDYGMDDLVFNFKF